MEPDATQTFVTVNEWRQARQYLRTNLWVSKDGKAIEGRIVGFTEGLAIVVGRNVCGTYHIPFPIEVKLSRDPFDEWWVE